MRYLPIVAISLFTMGPITSLAQNNTPVAKTYSLKALDAETGSIIKRNIVENACYPLNKTYSNFTPEEKAKFQARYSDMPESDEPPFPTRGMAPILRDVMKLADALRAEGSLSMSVTIDATGAATQVSLLKSPSKEFANAVAYVLITAKYKPAVCGGQACTMDFPFRMSF
jgi:Gram-negative bacterial TonB protein C-terminal